MTHQEYNTLMRLIDLKAERIVRIAMDRDILDLDEDIDELESVLRAHICEDE